MNSNYTWARLINASRHPYSQTKDSKCIPDRSLCLCWSGEKGEVWVWVEVPFACEATGIYGSARDTPHQSRPWSWSSWGSTGQLWWWSAILLRFNWIFFVGQQQQQQQRGNTTNTIKDKQQESLARGASPFRKVAMKAIMKRNSLTKGSQLLFLLPFVAVVVAAIVCRRRLPSGGCVLCGLELFAVAVVRPHQII